MTFEIKMGSVTNAQRAKRLLQTKGYKPILKRIENPQPSDGCGYVVRVTSDDEQVLRIIQNSGLGILGVEVL